MSATHQLGMSGYNNRVLQPYVPQKGQGINAVPIGITALNIRPFTNKDYTNNFKTGPMLPHPIKHYRKGRAFNYPIAVTANGGADYEIAETNRGVNTTTKGTMIKQTIDNPGAFSVIQNPPDETTQEALATVDCTTCKGLEVVTTLKPNKFYLTNNPEPNTENGRLCCNQEAFAQKRVIYATTNLAKNYYTTHAQYMQNRCQLYDQRAFNFLIPADVGTTNMSAAAKAEAAKPGGPLSLANAYLANCQCNAETQEATMYALSTKLVGALADYGIITQTQKAAFYDAAVFTLPGVFAFIQTLPEPAQSQAGRVFDVFVSNPYWGVPYTGPTYSKACNTVIYKPNNYKYATQGAVSSSTRMLRLNVNTITSNAASFKSSINYASPVSSNGSNNPFVLKSKVAPCNPAYFTKNGNPKTCPSLAPVSTNKIGLNAGRNGRKVFVQNMTG
jgi:hypothetical protein